MNDSQTRIEACLSTLALGHQYLAQLESLLSLLTYEERVTLAQIVIQRGLPAPRIVMYDYSEQQWYVP